MADETYTALTSIGPPGSMVFGYRRGDEVAADVVDTWGLVVGEHVTTDPIDPTSETVTPPPVPGPEDTVSTWQGFAVSRGMDPADADAADIEELQAYAEDNQPAEGEAATVARPADGAVKSAWVDYVVAAGGDESWARDGATTKADLQGWSPLHAKTTDGPAGDPVAMSATRSIQAADD